jgi:hypothetical protein
VRSTFATGTAERTNDDLIIIERVIEVAGQFSDVKTPEARNMGLGVGSTSSRQDSQDLHCRFKFGREEVLVVPIL